ncbi:chorion peroxidase [Eurytemora carolleeae]|uniref:chorion peroxidase n=1 Tax=Eurytemora carolleeae TaxID=1294199 RepID=UPI000C75689F|nr:chorion peroxidase [Eurytemora carolleeae]|eukprot:XP_023335820.1 chorion peroxidase-like [Eurytemora affinis]
MSEKSLHFFLIITILILGLMFTDQLEIKQTEEEEGLQGTRLGDNIETENQEEWDLEDKAGIKNRSYDLDHDAQLKHAQLLEKVIRFGLNQSEYLITVQEKALYDKGIVLNKSEPAHFVSVFNKQKKRSKNLSKYAYATLHASSLLSQQFMLTRQQVLYGLERVELRSTSLFDDCPLRNREARQDECSGFAALFRTPDGTCNNFHHPTWGASFTPFLRFLPPDYSDGIEAFRRSVSNGPLPNPRIISSMIHRDVSKDTNQFTMMVMQWGQFLDHDITSTPVTRGFNESILKCCSQSPETMHPDCQPIMIPADDSFYSKFNVSCMEFVRSSPGPRRDCSLGPRDQINQITSYIDASNVYGSTPDDQHSLRLLKKGKLKYTDLHIRKPLLPPLESLEAEEACRIKSPNLHCFHAGDERVNEQPGLATMHTLWLREHNRVAVEMGSLNPHWSDDRVFLETRRFIGAVVQHITYNEWLPIILGPRVLEIFELRLLPRGYYRGYNASVNPTVANAFGAAAFRFGHSLVKNTISRCNKEFRTVPFHVDLHKEMNNPSNLHNFGSVDRILLSLCDDKMARRDEFITEELTNRLFQTPKSGFGMDLMSLNIQRGRDHGLAPYNIWREQCGLKRFTAWIQMETVMEKTTVNRLENVYEHVDDIDLFTGGMAEKPVVGGIVGPTFSCILGQQFLNLRKGDRFWYENGDHPGAFTPSQLQEIRKTSLARVICDCLDDIDMLQPFAFLQPDQFANQRTVCKGQGIQRMNLDPWKEELPKPQQFNSESLYPELADLLTDLSRTGGIEEQIFADEAPARPSFSNLATNEKEEEDDLKFINGGDNILQIFRKPSIGLESDEQYNDELPNQLNPEQYYRLNWALNEDRQDLNMNQESSRNLNSKTDLEEELRQISFQDLLNLT